MEIFGSLLSQMLFLFLCILIGFTLNRTHVIAGDMDMVESRLLTYVCMPAMVFQSFRNNCTPENLAENAGLLLVNAGIIFLCVLLGSFLAPKFTKNPYEQGIYRYSIYSSNYGFMGNAMVLGVLGEAMLYRYLIFTLPTSLFFYIVAIRWLMPWNSRFTFRSLVNPLMIALAAGLVFGLSGLPVPAFLDKTLSGLSACYSPLAMVMTGFVIGKYDLRALIRRKDAYVITGIRLLLIPLAMYGIARLIRLPHDAIVLTMFFTAMPCGINTIVFPAAYGQDETIGAGMAVVSNVLGLITVPLLISMVL